jgi:transcriptional regulator with XRE-family HTH domain
MHALGLTQERLQAELDQARASVARPAQRTTRPIISAEALRQMDAVAARLNVPWSDVLDAIERSTTQRVALLTLEPDAGTGNVALTAEARSLDELLNYAEVLGEDAAVASVRLGQHDLRPQEPGQPVRMTLSIAPVPFAQ